MIQQINIAKDYFYKKDYKQAFKIFSAEKDYYSAGLCAFLLKKPLSARKYWKKIPSCLASNWGLYVLDFIELKTPIKKPTFFQTRAFLEIYINLLLENELIEWAQNLIASSDLLHQSNPESYKFIARALYANGYFELAIVFCKRSLKLFYCDPEAFLILSQCHYLLGDLGEALDCINRVNDIIDDYFPAIVFDKILRDEIKKKNETK